LLNSPLVFNGVITECGSDNPIVSSPYTLYWLTLCGLWYGFVTKFTQHVDERG